MKYPFEKKKTSKTNLKNKNNVLTLLFDTVLTLLFEIVIRISINKYAY